jgi:hypothetical protein
MTMISNFDQVRAFGTEFQASSVPAALDSPCEVHHLCSSIQVSYESRTKKLSSRQKPAEAPPAPGFEREFSRMHAAPAAATASKSRLTQEDDDDDEEEPDDEKDLFAHQFTLDGIRFNWNATTRGAIYRIIKTFREARLLKFDLTLNALHPVGSHTMIHTG